MSEIKKPYISLNKMAEYMTAKSIRRRQIVKVLKKDKDFYKVYYSEVRKTLPKYFKSNYDTDIVDEAIARIEAKDPESDWDKSDFSNSIIALENIMDSNLPNLLNYEFLRKNEYEVQSIDLGGVKITIKPELFLKNKDNGKIGAIKSHIAKTPDNQLEEENRVYAATILKFALIQNGIQEKDIDNSACISYDIFKKDYSCSSNAFRRTMSAVEAACEEIVLRWDAI